MRKAKHGSFFTRDFPQHSEDVWKSVEGNEGKRRNIAESRGTPWRYWGVIGKSNASEENTPRSATLESSNLPEKFVVV